MHFFFKGKGVGRRGEECWNVAGRETSREGGRDQQPPQGGLPLGPCPFPGRLLSSPRPCPFLRPPCFFSGVPLQQEAEAHRGWQAAQGHTA